MAYLGVLLLIFSSLAFSNAKEKEELFQRVRETPQYQEIKESCESDSNPQTCIIKKLGDLYDSEDPTIKNLVHAKGGKEQGTMNADTIGVLGKSSISDEFREAHNPHLKALEDYLAKKLGEALYNGSNPETRRGVDHGVFFDLMQSQLGKNLVTASSNYCLHAGKNTAGVIFVPEDKDKRDKNRQNNLEKLGEFDQDKSLALEYFGECIRSIKYMALAPQLCKKIEPDITPESCDTEAKKYLDEKSEVRKEAQIVHYQMERMRNNMVAVRDINEGWIKHEEKNTNFNKGFQAGNAALKKDSKVLGELTSITSGEYLKAETEKGQTVQELFAEQQAKVEACEDNPGNAGCEDFFISDATELDKEYEEELARVQLQYQYFKKDASKDDLEKILLKEGRDPAQVKELLNDEKKLQEIRNSYAQKIKDARTAIIEKNKKELEKLKIQTGANHNFAEVSKKLQEKNEQFAQLLHFTNVVSGFLSVGEEGKEEKQVNIELLKRELGNNYYEMDDRDPASENTSGDHLTKLRDQVESNYQDNSTESGEIKVEDVNRVFIDTTNPETPPTP